MMDYFFKPLRQLNAGSELNCGPFLVREYYERYRSHTPCAEFYFCFNATVHVIWNDWPSLVERNTSLPT